VIIRAAPTASANQARDFQQGPCIGIHPLDLLPDRLAQALREHQLASDGMFHDAPSSIAVDEHAARDQLIEQADEEQRVAFGPQVNGVRQCVHRRLAVRNWGKALHHVRRDSAFVERWQLDSSAELAGLQVACHAFDQIRAGLARSISRDDQHSRRLTPPCERGEPVDRRRIAPVQVLDLQNQCRVLRQRFESVGQLAQHALWRRADGASCEQGCIGGCGQRGKLRQPQRCEAAQGASEVATQWRSRKSHQ
jgi:hypothetical protein